MNEQIDEKNRMPSANDAKVIVGVLWQHGVIRINRDELQCKRKIIELGLALPLPDGKSGCLVYGREGDTGLYLFVCVPGLSIYGFRFDIAKYQSNPLPGGCKLIRVNGQTKGQ